MIITRTPSTEGQYSERASWLRAQAIRENDNSDNIEPMAFASWLLRQKPRLAHATWRLYRSAARWSLSQTADGAEAAALLQADAKGRGGRDTLPDDEKSMVGSCGKATFFRHADFQKLATYLKVFSRSEFASTTADFIRAGLVTGLRPIEWGGARLVIENGRQVLRVQSAKATNGRGTGEWRVMDVTDLAPVDLAAIQRMTARGLEWLAEDRYAVMQGRAAGCLRAACDEIWPEGRRYALYSCRHQAIANMRATLPITDVQALVGHADGASTAGYGRGASPWSVKVMTAMPRPIHAVLSAPEVAAEPLQVAPIRMPSRTPWAAKLFPRPAPVAGRSCNNSTVSG